MSERALYYPHIHIQDVNWLKATLLLFSQVRRMVPVLSAFEDSDAIKEFTSYDWGQPLLYPAQLERERVMGAQEELARRLNDDAKDEGFKLKYGLGETMRQRESRLGFQIHQGKLSDPLKAALNDNQLAWDPINKEPSPFAAEYVEVHPRLGEAIMSTLAIAAATGEGLDVVGDNRSGKLHKCLLEKKEQEVYDYWLHPTPKPVLSPPQIPEPKEVFEYFVSFRCDVTDLTAESLASLKEDREPLRKLLEQLRALGSGISAMDPGKERDQCFKDVASKVLDEWQKDRMNLSSYWRKFLGEDLMIPGEKFIEKVAEKTWKGGEAAVTGAATSAAGAAYASGSLGATATCAVAGALGGLSIGIFSHGVKTYFRTAKAERESPYRYLTLMEKAGVVFRSELGAPVGRDSISS